MHNIQSSSFNKESISPQTTTTSKRPYYQTASEMFDLGDINKKSSSQSFATRQNLEQQSHENNVNYFNSSRCSQGNLCHEICVYEKCSNNAIVCIDRQCQCRKQHKKLCSYLEPTIILNMIQEKKQPNPSLITKIENVFDQLIDMISIKREQIINEVKCIGLSEMEKQLLKQLSNKQFDKLNGKRMSKIISSLDDQEEKNKSNYTKQRNKIYEKEFETEWADIEIEAVKQLSKFDQILELSTKKSNLVTEVANQPKLSLTGRTLTKPEANNLQKKSSVILESHDRNYNQRRTMQRTNLRPNRYDDGYDNATNYNDSKVELNERRHQPVRNIDSRRQDERRTQGRIRPLRQGQQLQKPIQPVINRRKAEETPESTPRIHNDKKKMTKFTKISQIQPGALDLNIFCQIVKVKDVGSRYIVTLGDESGTVRILLKKTEQIKQGNNIVLFKVSAINIKDHIELRMIKGSGIGKAKESVKYVNRRNNISV